MTEASAPGKLILCGEHAVVYGRPAIALPLASIRAHASIEDAPAGSGLSLYSPELDQFWTIQDAPDDPMSELAVTTLRQLGHPHADLSITLTSAIPIASGMGSGAAIATALVRALASHLNQALAPAEVSALVYTSEQRYHGTPSGIDNTVIAYEQGIWFERAKTAGGAPHIAPIAVEHPFRLLIGDTGTRSATHLPVGEVRRRWQEDPTHAEALFDQVAAVVQQIGAALAAGELTTLGPLLNTNQELLVEMGVSSPELERLVNAARDAGALGAKLSGAGWGGIMLALTDDATHAQVQAALQRAGATRVLETICAPSTRERERE